MTTAATSATDSAATRPLGPWRAAAAGWRVFVPTVSINALVQGALVLGDPIPALSGGFALLVAVSLSSIVFMVWLATCAAAASVAGRSRIAPLTGRGRVVLALSFAVAVVAVGGAVVHPLLPVVILLLAAFVLPAVASGGSTVSGFAAVAAFPLYYLLAVLIFGVVSALSWVIALVLGLFVTGAAALTWLWFGVVLVVLLCIFSSLYRRSGRLAR